MGAGDRFNIVAGNGLSIGSNDNNLWAKLDLDLPGNTEFKKLSDRVEIIEKRLCILQENEELQEKFKSLQQAYEAYKIIEKLVYDPGQKNESSK